MSILEILWITVKYGFIITAIASTLAILLLLFHPLRLNLKLRSTIRGQRAELWFVYLFRLFKIGIVATPHTQDIIVKVAFWKKRLHRKQREKPAKPASIAPGDFPAKESETSDEVKSSTEPDSLPIEPVAPTEEPTAQSEPPPPEEAEQQKPVIPQDSEGKRKDEIAAPIEVDKPEPETDKPVIDHSQQSPTPPRDPLESSPEPGSFRARLRKIKRNMAKKYKQSKYYIRIFMLKWRKLAPVAKKFYARSKKCFKIDDPNLVVYYALHEPYITGMFQGKLAVLSGAAQRFGFRFVPIPLFGQPTVYARSAATAVIMPWRLILALLGLIFEKELWIELWQLVKLFWAKWNNK